MKNHTDESGGSLREFIESRFDDLSERMGALETKVDERLYDTRPMWEAVKAELATLHEGLAGLKEGQERLHTAVSKLQADVSKLQADVSKLRIDVENLTVRHTSLMQEFTAFREETRKNFRVLERKFEILTKTTIDIQVRQMELEERVNNLEGNVS